MKKPNLIKLLAVTWLICVCTLYASLSHAGTIMDNFNGPAINTQLWTPFEESIQTRLSQQGGELRIQIDGGSVNSGAGLKSKFRLKGDFEMTVDYRLITWPEANGVRLGFEGPGGDSDANTFMVKRVSFGADEPSPPNKENYFAIFSDNWVWYPNIVPATGNGSLKLTRVGSTLTGYYANQPNTWQQIGSPHDYSAPGIGEWVELTLWAIGNPPEGQNVEIAFSNFQVTYDQIKFISFPLAAVDLLLLN